MSERRTQPPIHERADVIVVGAGAAGAAVTWLLASRGVDVLCLEQGGWVPPASLPTTRPDWELLREETWSPNPNVRRLPWDYPIDDTSSPIQPLLFNGVGGSTVMWSCHAPRFHPSDFRVRTLDGVGDDWPISYRDLEPHYDLNDRMMGVSGIDGDPANPPRPPRPMPPVPIGEGAERMASAMDRLGWHWWPTETAINSTRYGERDACVNCGPCELGCTKGAKADVAVTYWPAALRAGARLRTEARVRRVLVDDGRRASGVEWVDTDGGVHRASADVVVLAGNGIGTPRLLLNSDEQRSGRGLANGSGLVGRRLMLHPIAAAVGVFPERLGGHRGITACSIMSHEFYEADPRRGFPRGYQLQITRSHGPTRTALGGFGVPVPWGPDHHARFAEVFDATIGVTVMCEDLPDESNTVTLDPARTDSSGLPGAVMSYRVDRASRAALDHGLARAGEILREAGASEVHTVPLRAAAGFHLMGTARMGDDPRTSVVDALGACHDVPNLYIVDGSVFVTSAAVNPTPTIQAIALRTAEAIAVGRA